MDPKAKRTALRGITYGLYIIGTKDNEGVNGFAGNFLTQTSFEPPLVAIAVKRAPAPKNRSQKAAYSASIFWKADKKIWSLLSLNHCNRKAIHWLAMNSTRKKQAARFLKMH